MKTIGKTKTWAIYGAVAITCLLTVMEDASAVPSYSRRYGEECTTCHGNMWGALTPAGVTFRLSGYRAIFGKDLTPVNKDQEISKGVTIPAELPLSFITGIGVDSRSESRSGNGMPSNPGQNSDGTTLALEDASIFMTSPLGKHLSAFVEFPMYETKAWEFTPTGNYEARFNTPGRQVKFETESPTFEVAKFFWNNLFGDSAPRDSVNFAGGITHLPLGYASGKVRLSVNQYLIYERTALSLISPRKVDNGVVAGASNDYLFRISEPQVMAEIFGMTTFGAPVTDVSKKETAWGEYHVGISNGTNGKAANNAQKDIYGRAVLRYYGQSFGVSGLYSPDQYSDDIRSYGSTGTNVAGGTGVMSGLQNKDSSTRNGFDMTLSLVPFGVPLYLENQYMTNKESNPTGFDTQFKWHGYFSQLNWKVDKKSIAYARYDYVKGDPFDDTGVTRNGVVGITRSTPKETDWILGYQYMIDQNIKLVGEYRNHTYNDYASGSINGVSGAALGLTTNTINQASLKDNGFTVRMMFGF